MKTKINASNDHSVWWWTASVSNWVASSRAYTRRHDAIRGLARFLERVRAK